MEKLDTVISGSFRKHMEFIKHVINSFKEAGVNVLTPTTTEVVDPSEDFVILSTDDPDLAPRKLESNFMREIAKAKFLYVANAGGYVGQSAATEMAYAALKGVPIVISEVIKEISKDIPPENHGLFSGIASEVLPANEISKDSIEELNKKINEVKLGLSESQKEQMEKLVKVLLKGLSSKPV